MSRTTTNRGQRRPRRERTAGEQPGNSFEYLYWKLSEGRFQQMVGTILRDKYDPVRCYPIRMADQGVDAISHKSVIYQVKWTSKYQQNPETWLKATIEREREKILRLVEKGLASRYILVTSVAGTTTGAGTGSIQKLDLELEQYSKEFGVPIECWWQADLDAEINRMGDAIKWSFQEMLSGHDAIRYLIFGTGLEAEAARMRETMLKVVAAQSREDSKIRFSQAELEGVNLMDLFVDVHASLLPPPRSAAREYERTVERHSQVTRPAAASLLTTKVPLTFLLGVPGQGKSTLTQFLCQQHRAAVLASQHVDEIPAATIAIGEPKLPLRVELKEYAEWIDGFDPFDDHRKVSRRRSRAGRSVEAFLAELCSVLSGGRAVTVEEVHSLLERYPTLLVFDGLDEVANPELRSVVVDEIERLVTRIGQGDVVPKFQVLVTARPNSTELAEPDPHRFQRLRLEPLSDALQNEYVVKWCDARNIEGPQRSDIRRIFRDRTALDHVAQLADNPMQLTILLYLISKKGDAVPVSRTPLYSSYMEALLDREVAGGHINRNAAQQVEEVTAFLGWHMQSGVETSASAGTMARTDLENTILLYLREVEAVGEDAASLFRAATDRFWALTSKVEGLFEFAVQPVREYFAARFLAQWAGRDLLAPLSKEAVLAELVGRPYWFNTTRFYAGFASPNELGALRYGLEEAMSKGKNSIETRVAAWTLLADAVFVSNPRVQRDVVQLLARDDATLLLALRGEGTTEFAKLTTEAGGRQLVEELTTHLERNPHDALAAARIDMLKHLSPMGRKEFVEWWTPKLRAAVGGPDESRWLDLGARFGVGSLNSDVSDRLTLSDVRVRSSVIRTGIAPAARAEVESALIRTVLEGGDLGLPSRSAANEASLLAAAMRPEWFHAMMQDSVPHGTNAPHVATFTAEDKAFRNGAWKKLLRLKPEYERLRTAARLGQHSQGGTTEPWGAPARELSKLFGASWLAAEIAIAAAAAPHLRASGTRSMDGLPFGIDVDYGTLITEVHGRPGPAWWQEQHDRLEDDLSLRTWAVALLAAGTHTSLEANAARVDGVLRRLTDHDFEATAAAASRIALNGATRKADAMPDLAEYDLRTRLIASYFMMTRGSQAGTMLFSDAELLELAGPARSRWPIAETVATRSIENLTPELSAAITKLGPESIAVLFPIGPSRANTGLADQIITSPGCYSAEWLLYAHTVQSNVGEPDSLEKRALGNGWVPRVPRYS